MKNHHILDPIIYDNNIPLPVLQKDEFHVTSTYKLNFPNVCNTILVTKTILTSEILVKFQKVPYKNITNITSNYINNNPSCGRNIIKAVHPLSNNKNINTHLSTNTYNHS